MREGAGGGGGEEKEEEEMILMEKQMEVHSPENRLTESLLKS